MCNLRLTASYNAFTLDIVIFADGKLDKAEELLESILTGWNDEYACRGIVVSWMSGECWLSKQLLSAVNDRSCGLSQPTRTIGNRFCGLVLYTGVDKSRPATFKGLLKSV